MDKQKIISVLEDLVYEDINQEDHWKAVKEAKVLIKELKQALSLSAVNQQHELLEAFVKQIKEDNEFVDDITFQDINKFIASNCYQREQLLCLVDFKQVCLTKGRKYEMTREGKEHFELIGDNNTKTWGYKIWFKKVAD